MKKILFTIALLGMLASCSDFLEEKPKGKQQTAGYYETEEHAISATNAIYDYLIVGYAQDGLWDSNYGGVYFNYYWVLQDLFSDNAHSNMSSVDFQSVDRMQITQYNAPVEYLWRDFYQTIKACNVVIDRVPPIEMNETLKSHLIAEARFFRALMYFDLVRMFGDVPLHEHDMADDSNDNIPRTSKKDIYDLIISDLKIAEQDLKYESRMGGGQPYSLSATAMLARVYLTYAATYGNDKTYYQLAVDKAKEVIPHFPMLNEFEDLFKIPNRFNSEIIYGVNFHGSLSQGWKGGQFLVRLLPNVDKKNGGPENAQGYETATEDLYGAYSNSDKRKEVTLRKEFVFNDGTTEDLKKPYFFKYWDRAAEPRGNTTDAVFPILRTAEMYLIIAEALNELKGAPDTEATEALKTVRTRANNIQAIPTDYAGFKKAVLNERRLEFAIEGHRWFDLTRMCTPEEFVSIVKTAKPDANPQKYHVLFPLPQKDIQLSQGVLTQNEGYK